MPYIDTKYLGKCETCRHHRTGGCNTYCDHGEEYSPNLSKIPTADVIEIDDSLEIVIVSAIRYALGRRTYVPSTVIAFTIPLLNKLSVSTLLVLERDIAEADSYGDEKIDKPDWMMFLQKIREEKERRMT